jgi:hypothetical protein
VCGCVVAPGRPAGHAPGNVLLHGCRPCCLGRRECSQVWRVGRVRVERVYSCGVGGVHSCTSGCPASRVLLGAEQSATGHAGQQHLVSALHAAPTANHALCLLPGSGRDRAPPRPSVACPRRPRQACTPHIHTCLDQKKGQHLHVLLHACSSSKLGVGATRPLHPLGPLLTGPRAVPAAGAWLERCISWQVGAALAGWCDAAVLCVRLQGRGCMLWAASLWVYSTAPWVRCQ